MPDDHLRAHELEMLRALARVTERVVNRVLANEFTYVEDRRSADNRLWGPRHDPVFSDEASVQRALGKCHYDYLLAAGYEQKAAGAEAGKRAKDDWKRIQAQAEMMALDRLAER